MINLIAFMETVRTELLSDLWESVQERLGYLIDIHSLSSNEIEVNRTTRMWPAQPNPIFEDNEQVWEKTYNPVDLTSVHALAD